MSWQQEQQEKIIDTASVIITLLCDAVLVLAVGLINNFVTYIIEHVIFDKPIEKIDNIAFHYTYLISKGLIIAAIAIYVIVDIFIQVITAIKKIKRVSHESTL